MKRWSLKDKFRAIAAGSALIILLVTSIGLWRYVQFNRNKVLIQGASTQLLAELENSFSTTQMIGAIQADLTAFMETGSPALLKEVERKSQHVLLDLPPEARPTLASFLDKVSTLEIRMNSLRANNLKALEAGNAILARIEQVGICNNDTNYQKALKVAGQGFRDYQPIYITGILNGQDETLGNARRNITLIMESLEANLLAIIPSLPEAEMIYIKEIIELFYELDDGISTVAAIRQKVLDNQKKVFGDLRSMESQLASTSIAKSQKASSLMGQSLELASGYALLMFVSLAVITLFLLSLGGFMSRGIVTPLVSLVYLLKKFSKILASVNKQTVEESECYEILNSLVLQRHDEIGDVVRATKELMERMREISGFRQKIEADGSCEEVYFRLAKVFTEQLDLRTFVIYEIDSDDSLVPVYSCPLELEKELPEFTVSDTCRAKRTGGIVSSFADSDMCRVCPFGNVMNYLCIPMLVGGHVIGVVQFLLPFTEEKTEQRNNAQRLLEAQNYLEEALPVLQAKRFARKLEEMATKDQLTGLYNRRYLEVSLSQILAGINRRKTNLGILMCDMDFFKQVNDTYGHDAGDQVLSELSTILVNCVRESDMVIRFGGEEFLILLQDIEKDRALPVAEKIRITVEEHQFHLAGADIKKTVSIGVSEYPDVKAKGIWEVIKQADVALYNAKDSGRNCAIQFSGEMWKEKMY
ncbi:MAG: GGDEF domain-containing protein [Desulfobulbaceae bacterium]|nr:GGDEF domain-containing protein [Desulfobulbaceae bacterium]